MSFLEVFPGVKIAGLSLWLEGERTLVFSDTHFGFEEFLNKQGVLVPRFQYKDVVEHLRGVLATVKPKTVVINGDLKHEFGGISEQEWSEVLRFLTFLKDYHIVLVRGNHDTILGPIAGKKNVSVVEEFKTGGFLIVHGNRIPTRKMLEGVHTVVIGHEHPAIGLRERGRTEKVKCFMVGVWKGRNLVVLPSLNFVTEGIDVLKEHLLSPLLQHDLSGFRIVGVEKNELLDFGTLGNIEKLLSDG
jgi:putative SbcD/Mre11-related phosphoesterase